MASVGRSSAEKDTLHELPEDLKSGFPTGLSISGNKALITTAPDDQTQDQVKGQVETLLATTMYEHMEEITIPRLALVGTYRLYGAQF